MESVDAKLARAREHLAALDQEIRPFLESARPTIVFKSDEVSAWLVIYWTDAHPPIRLSVIAGDVLFNLRSALDNLVCGLVRVNNPQSACSGTKFPIYREKPKSAEFATALKGLPPDAVRAIEKLQPFNRPPGSVEVDPLNMLNTLCNHDKHRAVNFAVGYSKNVRLTVHDEAARVLHEATVHHPMYAGEIYTVALPDFSLPAPPTVRVQSMGTNVLSFRDEGPWADRSVRDILDSCTRYVEERVMPALKAFFQ